MKPWTEREIAMLGTATDAAVAKRLKRTVSAVLTKRHAMGIAAFRQHSREWTQKEIAMLGKMSDAKVAEALGVTRKHVIEVRRRLGIETANPRNRPA